MTKFTKKVIQKILNKFRLRLIRLESYNALIELQKFSVDSINKNVNEIESASKEIITEIVKRKYNINLLDLASVLDESRSQLGQDLLAFIESNFSKSGFFVEFGATNGIDLSNTYLLEKIGWTGILAEPARIWENDLIRNRNCKISNKCVWSESNTILTFSEVPSKGEYSTLTNFQNLDMHHKIRNNSLLYEVETISLLDLLDNFSAPRIIEFLSVDTEGSEYEILKSFDFSKYKFGLICVEHNFGENREKIHNLLANHGYTRIYEDLSRFDDWFIPQKSRIA